MAKWRGILEGKGRRRFPVGPVSVPMVFIVGCHESSREQRATSTVLIETSGVRYLPLFTLEHAHRLFEYLCQFYAF